ncbi:hypothetical protein AVEN_209574-1 [Araneus ventricosus]|uniref:Uncharacterized protein n=1 Tax=Araneus ventricosus TaxID=182803 RepID=A0A4Y2RM12_ARAVE|nr:hypothetical protein AVEN_209574-1 [Araneus ventricosus]
MCEIKTSGGSQPICRDRGRHTTNYITNKNYLSNSLFFLFEVFMPCATCKELTVSCKFASGGKSCSYATSKDSCILKQKLESHVARLRRREHSDVKYAHKCGKGRRGDRGRLLSLCFLTVSKVT